MYCAPLVRPKAGRSVSVSGGVDDGWQSVCAGLVLTICVVVATPPAGLADWDIQTVDSAEIAAALELDSAGVTHICYFTPTGTHLSGTSGRLLKYANNGGTDGAWVTETVMAVAQTPSSCDLALGSDGSVHIVSVIGERLLYHTNAGGSWATSEIAGSEVMWRAAIALDSTNTPHVTFSRYREHVTVYVQYMGTPYYATLTPEGWEERSLSSLAGEPEYYLASCEWSDVAVRSDDSVYLIWKSSWSTHFMFPASYDSSIMSTAQIGLPASAHRLEINAADDFYAAGMDNNEGTIKIAVDAAEPGEDSWYWAWRRWDVDNSGSGHYDENAQHLGLAITPAGEFHVVFYDVRDGDLKYLWQSPDSITGSGSPPATIWPRFTEIVESDGDVGHSPDIGVDSGGDPHIVYLDLTNQTVKYGKRHEFTGPQLRVSPTRWNYGRGHTWPNREGQEFYITNQGTEALRINEISVENTTAGDDPPQPIWYVDLSDTQMPLGALPATILPGELRSFVVEFSPDVYGTSKTGEVSIESNWGSFVIGLRGQGIGGDPMPGPSCFVATAAYGSPMASEVELLRRFRDRYLLTNPPGRLLVRTYYNVSPPLARVIAENEQLRTVTRWCLTPLVHCINAYMPPPDPD